MNRELSDIIFFILSNLLLGWPFFTKFHLHGFFPQKVLDSLCYPGSFARPHSFQFARYNVEENVQGDFIERFNLLFRTCDIFKMLVPVKQVNAVLDHFDISLAIAPNPTFVRGRCQVSDI